MVITKESVLQLSNMEVAQMLGTLWCMLNAPEAQSFIKNVSELEEGYGIIKDENIKRFGIKEVTNTVSDLQYQLLSR